MDFLKSAVASAISKGPLGAYQIGDRVDVESSIWTLNNATKREGNIKCSVFTFDVPSNRSRLPLARNAVRKARTLRHPGVVKVLDTIETETQLHIVTERVTPLAWYTRRKSLAEETLKWGLCSVARTIKFINEEASSVHGCLRTSAVYASDSGEWKVGSFELLSSVKDEEAVIYNYSSLVPDLGRSLAPEVANGNWDAIKRNPLSAVDSYGYGLLIYESFNGGYGSPEQASQAKGIPRSFQQTFKRLLNPNPKARLSVAHFLEQGRRQGGFFQTPLINLTEGIESLGLMSDGEKDQFFKNLEKVSDDFPEDFMKRKILPELLKSVEFGGGGPKVFKVILQIGTKLSDDEYESQLTPVLVRLFASPDRAMRVCLLDNLPLMVDRVSNKIINDKIFPNITSGFSDQAPLLREQTVKSVLTLVPKLSDRTVNGELLKHLAKTANDSEPGIRTNTTICLGKIAKSLSQSTRSKVLIAAFTRSLRDPFIHARNAALMALTATSEMFTEDDCANKILPALCPTLLDKEKTVRDQSNRTLDQYLTRIRKHAQTLPETISAPSTTNNSNASVTSQTTSTPRMDAPAAGDASSWTGWAISSFTNKVSAASGEIQPRASTSTTNGSAVRPGGAAASNLRPSGGAAAASLPNRSASAAPTAGAAAAARAVPAAKPQITRASTDKTKLAASFTAPEVAEDDSFWDAADGSGAGWGDEEGANNDDDDDGAADAWGALNDDWDDDPANGNNTAYNENVDDSAPASSRPSISVTSQKSPLTSPAPTTATFEDAGEPDFAGWLKAQQASKTSTKGLPKGLGTKTAAAGTRGSLDASRSRPGAPRAQTTGTAKTSAVAETRKEEVKKQKAVRQQQQARVEDEEDGWGDAWD